MEYLSIEVPDLNDSVSSVVLCGVEYRIRFRWNDKGGFWTFSLYDALDYPLALGIKMVPEFPLNLLLSGKEMPAGVFAVMTAEESVKRNDFVGGKADFIFIPTEENDPEEPK